MTRTALNVIDWYIDNDFCRGANGEDESALIADRALMSAAPSLLAICEDFIRGLDQGDQQDLNERTYIAMMAAIKKAKGQ